jgi:glycosyltransferase involved in cell wall biosynthesis
MSTVSAIITTYNSGALLEEALASVLAQTCPPDEILVVDDGSSDDTAARMSRFGARVRYHWQPNAGTSEARNTGWRLAKSPWIAYLDADDLWLPEKLEHQLASLADHPETEAVFGLMQNFAQPGCEHQFDVEKNLLNQWVPGWIPGTGLIQRAVVARHGFNPGLTWCEILDWIIRLREAGTKMTMLEIPFMRRRLHQANKSLARKSLSPESLQVLGGFLARRKARLAASGPAPQALSGEP